MNSSTIKLHNLLLIFQKQQRFAGLRLGIPADQVGQQISHAEQSILFILDAEPEKNIRDLAILMNLERSWMSRLVSGLEKKQLVETYSAPYDLRAKLLQITSKGKKLLAETEKISRKIMMDCLNPINPDETKKLEQALKILADGFEAPHYHHHQSGHPVSYQLGRLSAATGVLGQNVLGFDLTNTQLHIFQALVDLGSHEVQVSEINRLVPFDMSTVSRTIKGFEKKGWIKKKAAEHDKRSQSIALTKKGTAFFDSYHTHVKKIFEPAISALPKKQLNTLISILEKLTSTLPSIDPSASLGRMKLRPMQSEDELKEANLLLEKLENIKNESKSNLLGIYSDTELKGVIRIDDKDRDSATSCLTIATNELPLMKVVSLLETALKSAN